MVPTNVWTHLAVTDDGAGTVRLFLNGAPITTNAAPGAGKPATAPAPTSLGRAGSYPGQYVNGQLDEVAMYNRALSASEVLALYNAAPAGSACDLNGDGSTNVNDVQSCANQATLVTPCTTGDINRDTLCNVLDVQRVVNAVLGGVCVVTP
jgi:hypothetical protein